MLGALSARGGGVHGLKPCLGRWLPRLGHSYHHRLLLASPALPLYQPRGVYTDGSGTRSHGALFASILIYSMFYSSELTQV